MKNQAFELQSVDFYIHRSVNDCSSSQRVTSVCVCVCVCLCSKGKCPEQEKATAAARAKLWGNLEHRKSDLKSDSKANQNILEPKRMRFFFCM